jgi:hypothetical protein
LQALPLFWPSVVMLLIGIGVLALRRHNRPVMALAVLGALFPALLQFAIARPLYDAYDVRPMAHAVRAAQDAGHVVAHAGNYHAQYQFFGRLRQPLVVLQGAALPQWLAAHPDGYAVVYVKNSARLDGIAAIEKQPYRGETALLLDAANAQRLLGAAVAIDAPPPAQGEGD